MDLGAWFTPGNVFLSAIVAGVVGNVLAALPWTWAKRLGNALCAVSVDGKKLVQSARGKTSAGLPLAPKSED